MAANPSTPTNWSDTSSCPFCGAELSSPGAGFVDHIHDNGACESSFETWRENIAGDLKGGWSG